MLRRDPYKISVLQSQIDTITKINGTINHRVNEKDYDARKIICRFDDYAIGRLCSWQS